MTGETLSYSSIFNRVPLLLLRKKDGERLPKRLVLLLRCDGLSRKIRVLSIMPYDGLFKLLHYIYVRKGIMRVTAFIGAGACIDIDGPSTACITKKVRSVQQEIFVPPLKQTITKPFIEAVALHLETFWRDEPNFEDIFHAIEMLDSCRVGWDITAAKQFRPALSAFVGTTDKSYFNVDMLIVAKKDLISTVAKQVAAHDSAFNPNSSKHYWYSAFWRQATKRPPWDIVTTNYDMCIEKSLD